MPSRTSGAEGGPGKRIGSNPDTAPRSDPYIMGTSNRTAIATLVERTSRSVILVHLGAKRTSAGLCGSLVDVFGAMPPGLAQSLTWDQGKEMACHLDLSGATGMPVYFCRRSSPWQRGSNENTVSVVVGPGGPVRQAGAGSTE